MMSKIFKSALTLLLLAAVVYSGSVFSQEKVEKKIIKKEMVSPKDDDRSDEGFKKLKLSPEQKKSIMEIKTKMMKEALPIKNQIGEKEAHLKTISTGDNIDMNAVNNTIDEISVLKAKMMKMHMANRQEIRKVLNDEQKLIFDIKGPKGMKGCCQMGPGCDKMPGCGMGKANCMGKNKGMGKRRGQMPEPPMMPPPTNEDE
jgi:Spy/CpxP family protein refolding chaperone